MSAFWSGRDDRGELGVVGGHCTVGCLTTTTFDICCSVVLAGTRHIVSPNSFLELDGLVAAPKQDLVDSKNLTWKVHLPSAPFSEKAHQYVSKLTTVSPKATATSAPTRWGKDPYEWLGGASEGSWLNGYEEINDYIMWETRNAQRATRGEDVYEVFRESLVAIHNEVVEILETQQLTAQRIGKSKYSRQERSKALDIKNVMEQLLEAISEEPLLAAMVGAAAIKQLGEENFYQEDIDLINTYLPKRHRF